MSDFEYFFSFFALLLGLTVTEIASKFADAIEQRKARPIGLLTPLLAVFVLLDVTASWLWIWSAREAITIKWTTVFAALVAALTYYLCASLVFPRSNSTPTLDEHYWQYKRPIIAGIALVNAALLAIALYQELPHLDDVWFFVWQTAYYAPLIVLLFSRRRALDVSMLSLAIFAYLLVASSVLPSSQWGDNVGINGTKTAN